MSPPLVKILHVDDDAVMRLMIQKSLERSAHNFNVISCSAAAEFMDVLSTFHPDLLIIDVVMPVLDGPTLLGNARNLQYKMPAIFVTGQEHLEFDDKEKLDPIIGIIHKPFSPLTLGDELMKLWEKFHDQFV